jgi:hypothetical protein
MKSVYIPLSFILLSFSSCKKDASYTDLPEFREKIVINAFLSPDQTENKIYVSLSKPRFGELTVIEPAKKFSLFLYENSKEVQLDTTCENQFLNSGLMFHIRNFSFKEGQTYHLKVISDHGIEADATCNIPVRRNFNISVDTTFRNTTDDYGRRLSILSARISITDFPGEANYYRLLYILESHHPGTSYIPKPYWSSETGTGEKVRNDIGQDGKKYILSTIEFRPFDPDSHPFYEPDSSFLRVYVLNTDKPYYDFHMSLNNYSVGDTPFTEPSFLYSNVEGGLGIFASYVVDSLIYRLK